MSLVSVVIPAYNAVATLEETVRSVQAQTWREFEILIVDDGSRDETNALAQKLAESDDRIRVIGKSNGGVAEARNVGIGAARGDLVAPVDADDLWHPDKIERQLKKLTELGPECGFVYTLSRRIDAESFATGFINGLPGYEGRVFLQSLSFNFVGNGSAILARRAALEEAGGYEPALHRSGVQGAEDFLVHALMARRWLVGAVAACLCGYRVTPGAMSGDPTRMRRSRLAAIEIIAARHPETPEWALNAARAASQAGLAAALATTSKFGAAASAFSKALASDPRAALDVAVRDELRQALGPAARQFLVRSGLVRPRARRGAAVSFMELAPDAFAKPTPAPLSWLKPRLAAQEAAFFRDHCGTDGPRPALGSAVQGLGAN